MRISRHDGLGRSLKLGLMLLLALAGAWQPARADINLGTLINWADPRCTQYTIIGLCFCAGVPCGYRVFHYLPVVVTETVNAPGDSVVTGMLANALKKAKIGSTRQISKEQKDNTFEAHVWEIPTWMRTVSSAGMSCLACTSQSAEAGSVSNYASGGRTVSLCGDGAQLGKAMQTVASSLPGYLPKLLYATEIDAFNWRTGCRDTTLTNLLRSNALTCTVSGLAAIGGNPLQAEVRSILGDDACVGTWGPLYPRQMRSLGPSQITASALAAYRAMSNAAKVFDTMHYALNLAGKMQMGYPEMSTCFHPGESPMLWQNKLHASKDGKYAWVYWVPVTCCISFSSVSRCMANTASGT